MKQLIDDIWAGICSIVGIIMFAAIIGMAAGFTYGIFMRLFA